MSIKPEILALIVCPVCHGKVEMKPDNSGLQCVACHRVYPIRDEIPVLLVDEATIENPPAQSA